MSGGGSIKARPHFPRGYLREREGKPSIRETREAVERLALVNQTGRKVPPIKRAPIKRGGGN